MQKTTLVEALIEHFMAKRGIERSNGHYTNGGVREIEGPNGRRYVVKYYDRVCVQCSGSKEEIELLARQVHEYRDLLAQAGVPVTQEVHVYTSEQSGLQFFEIASSEGENLEELLTQAGHSEAEELVEQVLRSILQPLLRLRDENDILPSFGIDLKLRNICGVPETKRVTFIDFMVPKLVINNRLQAEWPPLTNPLAQAASEFRHRTGAGVVGTLLADIGLTRPHDYFELSQRVWDFLDQAELNSRKILDYHLTGTAPLALFRANQPQTQRQAIGMIELEQPDFIPLVRMMAIHRIAQAPAEEHADMLELYRRRFGDGLHLDSDDYPSLENRRRALQTLQGWVEHKPQQSTPSK